MVTAISQEDFRRVDAAIHQAEKHTSAEIFAVLAERSDDYRFVAYSILALWVLIISLCLALLFAWQENGFIAVSWALNPISLLLFVIAQGAAFGTGILVLRMFPGLASMFVPVRIAHERAHSNAVRQFLAHGIQNTDGRTGLLIFISLEEQYAEILVDKAIEEKIGRAYFLDQIGTMLGMCSQGKTAEAFEVTINTVSRKLSEAFPRDKSDRNELADKLIVI